MFSLRLTQLPYCNLINFTQQCPPGKATDQQGQTTCTDCAIGRYQLESGGTGDCTACSAGFYADQAGFPTCISCAGGKYENGARTACVHCDEGKMSNPGSYQCDTCDHLTGYIATGTGNEQCEYCGPGFYADQGIHDCVACPASKYSVGGVNECLSCDAIAGKVQNLIGQSSCEFCGAGKKAVAEITNACVSCEVGTASLGGSSTCSTCDGEGEYSDNVGNAVCEIVGAGKKPNEVSEIKL